MSAAVASPSEWQTNPLTSGVESAAHSESTVPIPSFFSKPGKIMSNAGGVSVRIELDRTSSLASANVSGRLVIDVNKSGMKIGKVCVDVVGWEETLDKANPHKRLLVYYTHILQSASLSHLPPTDVVIAGPPDEHGMWHARKGRHTVNFFVPLGKPHPTMDPRLLVKHVPPPAMLPGSFWNSKLGGIRYVVCGTIHPKSATLSIPQPPLSAFTELLIYESAPLNTIALPRFPATVRPGSPHFAEATSVVDGKFVWGKKGEVRLKAWLRVPQAEDLTNPLEGTATMRSSLVGHWVAGSVGYVNVEVENGSERKVNDLALSLVRRLKTFSPDAIMPADLVAANAHPGSTPSLLPMSFSRQIVATRNFQRVKQPRNSGHAITRARVSWAEDETLKAQRQPHGTWSGVKPNEFKNIVLDVDIPVHARTIRFGSLVDVSYVLLVSATPKGSAPIQVEIPITILHPASLYSELPSPRIAFPRVLPQTVQAQERMVENYMKEEQRDEDVNAEAPVTFLPDDSVSDEEKLEESNVELQDHPTEEPVPMTYGEKVQGWKAGAPYAANPPSPPALPVVRQLSGTFFAPSAERGSYDKIPLPRPQTPHLETNPFRVPSNSSMNSLTHNSSSTSAGPGEAQVPRLKKKAPPPPPPPQPFATFTAPPPAPPLPPLLGAADGRESNSSTLARALAVQPGQAPSEPARTSTVSSTSYRTQPIDAFAQRTRTSRQEEDLRILNALASAHVGTGFSPTTTGDTDAIPNMQNHDQSNIETAPAARSQNGTVSTGRTHRVQSEDEISATIDRLFAGFPGL
ncbi:hypothetical protein BC832DRAFT_554477 [Gaertneriomyces semiglobifer]|nr:hypothetical protein BC832DRAFT_554477 [Gaertneriomyces semiglobifer]